MRPLAAPLTLAMGLSVAAGCRSSAAVPAALDPRTDTCATCRMVVSDARFASQIVAPYEEPRFFDDLGCLADYLRRTPTLPRGAVVFVADHRTRAWVLADRAVYTRVSGRTAPMGSSIIAHESPASRDADPDAAGGTPVDRRDVLPDVARPGGGR